jgi:hypothetical protein
VKQRFHLKNELNVLRVNEVSNNPASLINKRKITDYFMPVELNKKIKQTITLIPPEASISYVHEKTDEKKLSVTNSNTAKNGYAEEEHVCVDFNTNHDMREWFKILIPVTYDDCFRTKGNSKVDISSKNGELTAQVKKYKQGQFQQLDRHWVDDFIKCVPSLEKIQPILKNWCEYKLLENGSHVDKTSPIIKLCTSNYGNETLSEFIETLNINRRKILEYAFYGTNENCRPKYLIGLEYVNSSRNKMVVFRIQDIIMYLDTQIFRIKNSKSVIALGNNDAITLQRKGGDNGAKSSNQLQFKIIISALFNVEHVLFQL